jgi:uncharacterized protein
MIDRRSFARLISGAAASAAISAPVTRAATSRRIIKPKRLAAGDTLGLVLPASAEYTAEEVMPSKEQLELLGFKVVIGEHAFKDYYDYTEPLGKVPPHRVLAINRGERAHAIRVKIEADADAMYAEAEQFLLAPSPRPRALVAS